MRIKLISIIVLCIFIFTGCSVGAGIDTLLLPPKLSDDQSAINQALIDKVGQNIKLKYPKSGDYRSAFLIANIDDEPTDESIVFYEKTGMNKGESNLRVNILDKRDGKWVSVFDHASSGVEIDRIMISKLGSEGLTTIIVGYSLINQSEKTLEAYNYSNGVLKTIFADKYSAMEVMDINKDSFNELVLITNTTVALADATNKASTQTKISIGKVLMRQGDQFIEESEAGMDERAAQNAGMVRGSVGVDTPALFIDSAMGDGTIQTQIIYNDDKQLKNPLNSQREIMAKTSRPVGYASMDVDNDGVVEIPTLQPFPGYEAVDKSAQICVTDWLVFEQNALFKKNSGYYNIKEAYCFMLPSRWQGTVTVKEDITNDEVVFYKYSGAITDDMVELMRIKVMKRGTNEEQLKNGYQTIVSKGQIEYMVKVAEDNDEPLVLTMSEIMFNFYVLYQSN